LKNTSTVTYKPNQKTPQKREGKKKMIERDLTGGKGSRETWRVERKSGEMTMTQLQVWRVVKIGFSSQFLAVDPRVRIGIQGCQPAAGGLVFTVLLWGGKKGQKWGGGGGTDNCQEFIENGMVKGYFPKRTRSIRHFRTIGEGDFTTGTGRERKLEKEGCFNGRRAARGEKPGD